MRTNVKINRLTETTHEGARVAPTTVQQALRRTVLANMLFENTFYENGADNVQLICQLVKQISKQEDGFEFLKVLITDARIRFKLRHVPLLLLCQMFPYYKGRQMGDLVCHTIQRPDECGELLALYWKDNKDAPLAKQLKVGLARALKKFDEYQLAKWNKPAAVRLRDVLFLTHPKPRDEKQQELFNRVAADTLVTPDTWEVQLSAGGDKKEVFERLMSENKLGALAVLRNLRGMLKAKVDEDTIKSYLVNMKVDRVLPFRFISAAKHAPRLEPALETAMFKCLDGSPKMKGKTVLLIDKSGSMDDKISNKSELTRFDAACALAILAREVFEDCSVFTFNDRCEEIAPRRGFALRDALGKAAGGTQLGFAVTRVYQVLPTCQRLIVLTDEQSSDRPSHPKGRGYIINVADYKNGIGYGPWVTISGWSEAILDYIREYEEI